jgi:hypothetical protein
MLPSHEDFWRSRNWFIVAQRPTNRLLLLTRGHRSPVILRIEILRTYTWLSWTQATSTDGTPIQTLDGFCRSYKKRQARRPRTKIMVW